MKYPNTLYHGSGYLNDTLRPAFLITGEEVRWDVTESNRYLYCAEDKEFATEMGFASKIEKQWRMNHFSSKDDTFIITLDSTSPPILSKDMLNRLHIYLYTIRFKRDDGWVPVNNEHNNATGEWKTDKVITAIWRVEKIYGKDYFKGKTVIIKHPRYPREFTWKSSNDSKQTNKDATSP